MSFHLRYLLLKAIIFSALEEMEMCACLQILSVFVTPYMFWLSVASSGKTFIYRNLSVLIYKNGVLSVCGCT